MAIDGPPVWTEARKNDNEWIRNLWSSFTTPWTVILIGFTALLLLPAALWAHSHSEDIVVWLLDNQSIPESATRWMPGAIETSSTIAAGVLAIVAIPAYVTLGALVRRVPLLRVITDAIWAVVLTIARPFVPLVRAASMAAVATAALAGLALKLMTRTATGTVRFVLDTCAAIPVLLAAGIYLAGRAILMPLAVASGWVLWLVTLPAGVIARALRLVYERVAIPVRAVHRWFKAALSTVISRVNAAFFILGDALARASRAIFTVLSMPVLMAADAVRKFALAAKDTGVACVRRVRLVIGAAITLIVTALHGLVLLFASTVVVSITGATAVARRLVLSPTVRAYRATDQFCGRLFDAFEAGVNRLVRGLAFAIVTASGFLGSRVVDPVIAAWLTALRSIRCAIHFIAVGVLQGIAITLTITRTIALAIGRLFAAAFRALASAMVAVGRAFVAGVGTLWAVAITAALSLLAPFVVVVGLFKQAQTRLVRAGLVVLVLVQRAAARTALLIHAGLARVVTGIKVRLQAIRAVVITLLVFVTRPAFVAAQFVVAVMASWWSALLRISLSIRDASHSIATRIVAVLNRCFRATVKFLTTVFIVLTRPPVVAARAIAAVIAVAWRGLDRASRVVFDAVLLCLALVWQVVRGIAALLGVVGLRLLRALSLPVVLLQAVWRLLSDSITAFGRVTWQVTTALKKPVVAIGTAYVGGLVAAGVAVVKLPWAKIANGAIIAGVGALMVFMAYTIIGARPDPQVTVVHWTTGHLLRDGSGMRLLRQMAEEFNAQGHRSPSGKPIKVEVFYLGGAEQAPELVSRVNTGKPIDKALPDPTLVTPSASHWLINVNYAAGYDVIDLSDTDSRSLARTYVGIVTYKDMAECLGWPEVEIGYADLIALRKHPAGWASRDCANPDWGNRPLFAFTDPSSSDTGRAVLLSLYLIASGKDPESLSETDLEDPAVVEYVRSFQTLVDHYMPSTIPLNTKVCEGPRYGHFFLMPEDNLVHLVDGTEKCFVNGIEREAPPLRGEMVIVYPKEGSLLRENCACAVNAEWVDEEEAKATELWVSFLRQDAQQRSFVQAGFHAGTATLHMDSVEGLLSQEPHYIHHPERMDRAVATAIDRSWQIVKRPAIVTFVADNSGSMLGDKLRNEKAGLRRAMEDMALNNWVGLVTFGDTARTVVEVGPNNREEMLGAIDRMRASGETALYDAVSRGIAMTDGANGPSDAIRAVVVITDGRANRGSTCMHDLVQMTSSAERAIETFCGLEDQNASEQGGRQVARTEVAGVGLAQGTRHPVQIFYVAIGKDADLDIGRILAGATGAEFRGVTDADLSEVILEFSHYF